MAIETSAKEYICPGERHPISRSIHLARLAAAFPPCLDCPLREDARQIAPKTSALPAPAESQRTPRHDLFVAEGVRGVFLNEITQARAETIAAAFAIYLWDESPIRGQNDGIDRGLDRCDRRWSPATTNGRRRRASTRARSPACAVWAVT